MINAPDLLNNEVAIRMVLNDLNKKNSEIEDNKNEIQKLNKTIGELKLSPLFRIISAVFNAIAAIVMSIGTSLIDKSRWCAICLIVMASCILLFANLFPLLKRFFQ